MRGFKGQHDCQLSDFTVTELYIEYKERQTKNRQEDEPTATKRARKYKNKIWRTDGKFTNSSGRKTVIQAPRDDFDPLEILEPTGHANPESISSYSRNSLEKQRRMSNKLAGFNPSTTTTNSYSSHALREIVLNSSALPSNTAATCNRDSSASRSSYLRQGQLAGCLLE